MKRLLISVLVAITGCDKDSGPAETNAATDGDGTDSSTPTGTSETTASSGSTGEIVPWEPGPHCPRVPFYRCSQPPDPEWVYVDEQGCLAKPCSPHLVPTGCDEGEERVMNDVCTSLIGGCEDVDGTCMCANDPTCVDYGCRVIAR